MSFQDEAKTRIENAKRLANSGATSAYQRAKGYGIIPTQTAQTPDGAVIPPYYAWWAPWVLRVILFLLALVALGPLLDWLSPNNRTLSFEGVSGIFAFAGLEFLFHKTKRLSALVPWLVCGLGFPLIGGALLGSASAGFCIAVFALLLITVEQTYWKARFDLEACALLEDITQAKENGGVLYVLEDIVREEQSETIVTLGRPGFTGVENKSVRYLPDSVVPGWVIVLDGGRRFMAGMPPEMVERIEELGEQQ